MRYTAPPSEQTWDCLICPPKARYSSQLGYDLHQARYGEASCLTPEEMELLGYFCGSDGVTRFKSPEHIPRLHTDEPSSSASPKTLRRRRARQHQVERQEEAA